MDQVITNIQDELIVSAEPVVFIIKLATIAIGSSQLVQRVIEPIQMENPQFSKFQPVPIFGYST
jgi:hypothetical protein